MTQEHFDKTIERAYKYPAKAAIAIAMRLAYYHPALAMDWFERQPKAIQDDTETTSFIGFIGEDVTEEITNMSPISHEPLATLKID